MAASTRLSKAGIVRRSAIGAVFMGGVLAGSQAAWAQEALNGLVPTLPSVPTSDALGSRGAAGSDVDGPADNPSSAPDDTQERDGRSPARRSTVQRIETSTAKPRVGPPKLPALAAYPTAYAKPHGAVIDTIPLPVIGPTVAALPVPPPRRLKLDTAPFAPLGFSVGSLRFTPFIEQSLGFDSNPDQISVGVKPSGFSRTEGGFDLLSIWTANELRANMHGAYNDFFSNPQANRPDAAGTVDYRFDATRDISLDAEGRFVVDTQRPGSPELNVSVRDRPLVSSFGATAGGTDTIGRLSLGLRGSIDRTEYENGTFSNGTLVRLDDQNFNDYGITARADYEVAPGLRPFVELTGDTRVHDRRIDLSGFARDSNGILGRVGSTFEFSRLLTGTVSAGYENRVYDDRRLRDLQGPIVDASLIYGWTPLTTLTLRAATSFNETTVINSPGAESRSVAFEVSHALLRNLTLTGVAAYLNTRYINSPIIEDTVSGTLKASYAINRSIVVDASYNHQTLSSTIKGSGFTQDVVLFGMRLQH